MLGGVGSVFLLEVEEVVSHFVAVLVLYWIFWLKGLVEHFIPFVAVFRLKTLIQKQIFIPHPLLLILKLTQVHLQGMGLDVLLEIRPGTGAEFLLMQFVGVVGALLFFRSLFLPSY